MEFYLQDGGNSIRMNGLQMNIIDIALGNQMDSSDLSYSISSHPVMVMQ